MKRTLSIENAIESGHHSHLCLGVYVKLENGYNIQQSAPVDQPSISSEAVAINSLVRHRVDPNAEAKRIVLDKDYMLLLWKGKGTPKRICDIFWLKRSERYSVGMVNTRLAVEGRYCTLIK